MKASIKIVFLLFLAQALIAQNNGVKKIFISSSLGIAQPIGEFGRVDWFEQPADGLACTGFSLNVVTVGKYFKPRFGLGCKLSTALNPINHSSSDRKSPFWKSGAIGIGGLYRIPKGKWMLNADIWANYHVLIGTSNSFFIKGREIPYFNALFGGFTAELGLGMTYHLSSKYSLKVHTSTVSAIRRMNYGIIRNQENAALSKGFGLLNLNFGIAYWIQKQHPKRSNN